MAVSRTFQLGMRLIRISSDLSFLKTHRTLYYLVGMTDEDIEQKRQRLIAEAERIRQDPDYRNPEPYG